MEGDEKRLIHFKSPRDFYPRPHMEGDASEEEARGVPVISTHALTWRATG